MMTQSTKIERRIRLAGILLIAGLLVELATLRWSHPIEINHTWNLTSFPDHRH